MQKIMEMACLKVQVLTFIHFPVWMSLLSDEMKNTLRTLLVQCIKVQKLDLNKFPSQILCAAESIHFTQQCETAIQENKLDSLLKDLRAQLQKCV
jgi:dynein heavy chain 2